MKKQNFQEMWDDFKRCNICIMGIPERENREEIFEIIIAENFPNLMTDPKLQILEAQQTPK